MKKMRKLIPALSMLLIATIMLSTATFAWFTMNESVTASGMQVQAQAAGNLVIHTSPLTAANQAITVDLSSTTLKSLVPITYKSVEVEVEGEEGAEPTTTTAMKWLTANGETIVDSLYGNVLSGDLEEVTPNATPGDYFQEYVVYIATAGEAKNDQDIYVKINGISGVDQSIAPAYTIAFWVLPTNGTPDYKTPTTTVNYKTALENASTGVRINTAKVNVPSTDGVGVSDATGVKIVMRVYVDGDLVSGQHDVTTRAYNAITATNTWKQFKESSAVTGKTFKVYTQPSAGVYSEVDTSTWLEDRVIGDGYFYAIPANDTTVKVDTHYVNNQNVPTVGTNFSTVFSIEDSTLSSGT